MFCYYPPRRSLLNERDSEDDTNAFHRMHRHTSIGRDSDADESAAPSRHFPMHRLRTTRPNKKLTQDASVESGSSGEDDDEDGFELLTAENLFSTLLSRVSVIEKKCDIRFNYCLCGVVYAQTDGFTATIVESRFYPPKHIFLISAIISNMIFVDAHKQTHYQTKDKNRRQKQY